MRTKVIAGNWKMNGLKENINEIVPIIELSKVMKTQIILFPPITLISRMISKAQGSALHIGAQDCHHDNKGPNTGDISAQMIKDLGAEYVIVGHSERREFHKETNAIIKKKILTAWQNKLTTILCVGENLDIAKKSITNEYILQQLKGSLPANIDKQKLIIAYEPIWAIGTGKIPTLQQIKNVHNFIRSLLCEIYGKSVGQEIRIIYGGSLNKDNAAEIFEIKNVDGGLVGGASLTAKSFLPIIHALNTNGD